jgi:hypothetical protein
MRHKTLVHTHAYIHGDGHRVTFDPSQSEGRWGIPKGHGLRFALWSCGLLSFPIVAAVAGDGSVLIVVSILALGFEGFLLLFSSLPNQPKVAKAMRVTNFYSSRYLRFQGIFWTLLMLFVSGGCTCSHTGKLFVCLVRRGYSVGKIGYRTSNTL